MVARNDRFYYWVEAYYPLSLYYLVPMVKRKKKVKHRLPLLKSVHKNAWDLWSIKVRTKDADWRGYNTCVTCNRVFPWKQLQAGHFLHGKLDFDEMNINPQCEQCNFFRKGEGRKYAIYLARRYGLEAVDDLYSRAHQHPGYKRHELNSLIQLLTEWIKNNPPPEII